MFDYRFPVDRLIQHLKYREKLSLAPVLGQLLAARWQGEWPDVWLPMPLHPNRLATRGFNQAMEISRSLARASAIPLKPGLASRIADTPPQAGLKREARRRNMRHAFSCTPDVDRLHIGLVDDVMTTGSTLDALAHILIQTGASQVSCLVIARA